MYKEGGSILFTILKVIIRTLRKTKLRFSHKVKLKKGCVIGKNVILEGMNVIGEKAALSNTKVGYGTFIGPFSEFTGSIIGKFCSIGSHVKVITGQHPSSIFVSTHPAFFSLLKQAGFTFVNQQLFNENRCADTSTKAFVLIGNDVWIGSEVLILEGVKIGDGAIVGAGAVVTKDIEPYSINIGVPARVKGYRFEKKYIELLLKLKWWDKDLGWIKRNSHLFNDIERFIEEVGNIY